MSERPTVPVTIQASPKLAAYLDQLVALEHGWGESREEAAMWLVWESVNRLIERKLLRLGPPAEKGPTP